MKKMRFTGLFIMIVLISGCTYGPRTQTISEPTSVPTAPVFTARSTETPAATPMTTGTPAINPMTTPATFSVEISGNTFNPATVTVPKGSTVVWTQKDISSHTVTSSRGIFNSGALTQGRTFNFTFNETGNFEYSCSIHPYMTGKVIVE